MRNTIILTAILFLAVITATIYYFKNLNSELSSSKPLGFLPQNTLFIASIGNDKETKELFKEFEIFDAILGKENLKLWDIFQSRLLNRDKITEFTKGSDIYISFHSNKKEVNSLFTIPLKQTIPNSEITGILNDINVDYKTNTIDTLGHKIYQIHYGQKDSILNATSYHDILFASKSLDLITQIVNKHTKRLTTEQIDFFIKENPKTSPLSVYFPHQQYDSLINITQKNTRGPFINLFTKLHGQSAWNINFKEDALILTGESQLDQYPENYASIFKNQQKTEQYLYQYFPSNTSVYAEFSVSNMVTFQKDLHGLFKRRNEKIIDQIDTTKNTEILSQALGNNFALLETNNQNYLGFINIKDSTKLKSLMGTILENTEDSIGRFQKSENLYKQYGDVFKEMSRPYYTIIDSIMIIANSGSSLRDYRKDYLQNNLLTGTLGFIKLEKNQSKEANINIFIHSKNSNSKILNALKEPFRKNFNDSDNFGYKDFFSWSIQLSGNNGNMSSQIYAIYKSKNTLGTNAEWTFELGEKAITQPYVFNESDTSQFILIQKLDHTLYAISPKGEKNWSKIISGRILGDIKQLEDRSVIFTTDKNYLYRVDEKGTTLKGFPKTLDFKPTSSPTISVVNNKTVLVIPSNKKLLAFEIDGTSSPNWSSTEIEGEISTDILFIENSYKFGNTLGSIYTLDNNGKIINQTKVSEYKIENIGFSSRYKIIAIDSHGIMQLLNKESQMKKWKILNDSTTFYSSFNPIHEGKEATLTIVNNNKLAVYDIVDTLKINFEFNFTKTISNAPQYFISAGNNKVYNLGIASRATSLLYVFDGNGQLIEDFPVEGLPLFYFGKINYNSDSYLLCMRRDHKLYAFRQKK